MACSFCQHSAAAFFRRSRYLVTPGLVAAQALRLTKRSTLYCFVRVGVRVNSVNRIPYVGFKYPSYGLWFDFLFINRTSRVSRYCRPYSFVDMLGSYAFSAAL